MKRLFKLTLAVLSVILLSACGQQPAGREPSVAERQEETESVKNAEPKEENSAGDEETQIQEADDTMGHDTAFNFETKTVMLNSGYEMPIYGIGTYSLTDEKCVNSVTAALESGVRLIDTAIMYHNEESVGEAVRNSGIPREEIFVITKLYPNQFSDPETVIEDALKKLDIEYIDARVIIGLS